MSRQYRVLRKVSTIPVVAGGFAMIDLPRAYDYETLFLRVSGSLQVTTGATSVRAEAPCQLVPRVEIIAEGKNTIFSAPLWAACTAKYDRDLTQSGGRATTPPSAASIATYAVEAIGVIDFCTVDGARSKDSNFRTSGLSLFQLRLTFGLALDCFVPGAGVVVFSGTPTVEVFTSEMVEGADPTTGKFTTPIALKKVTWMRAAVAATNNNMQQRLPAGNNLKSVLLRTEGSVTAGEPSTAMLNSIMLQSGLDVRVNLSGPSLRAKNNADYGSVQAGYYIADITSKGAGHANLTELWDLGGQVEPMMVLDVVGGANNFVDFIVTEYILARAA
jgi:hypothetical protein